MKKILILVIFFAVSSCDLNNDEIDTQVIEKVPIQVLTDVDLKNIGEFHNEILEKIIFDENIMKKAESFSKIKSRTFMDSLQLMKDLSSYMFKFAGEHELTANGKPLVHSEFKFSDIELMNNFRAMNDQKIYTDQRNLNFEAINRYLGEFKQLNNISKTELFFRIDELMRSAKEELPDSPETLNVVLIGLSVGKYSNEFWNFSENTRKFQNEINGRALGWLLTAYADAQGAYFGATWGMIAGPAGSVIMGANGALLWSGTAYITGKYL